MSDDEREWIRDGHRLEFVCEPGWTVTARLVCPVPHNADLFGVAWDDLPPCRRSWTEEGKPYRDDPLISDCNFALYMVEGSGVIEAGIGGDFTIAGPVEIEVAWDAPGEWYVWRVAAASADGSGPR